MRVAVDGRSLSAGGRRGVARVTFELLEAMAARFPEDEWRVLVPRGAGPPPLGTSASQTHVPGRILFAVAALTGRPRLDELLGPADVVWLPAPAPVAVSSGLPTVLTLHDLSWVERPGDFTPYERIWHRLARPRSLARRATWVAAVSTETRRTAIERWRLDPNRIVVVPPPIMACRDLGRGSPTCGDAYFLWVGALEPRKGPDILQAAWTSARSRGLSARLIVAGEGRLPLTGPGVERRGHISDAELAGLYQGALALVMPSRLEGAGLPPLEAALCGTPSICSDLPVLHDSLGSGGAEWVPPDDADALAAALLRLAADPERRDAIAARARQAAAARADPVPAAEGMRALLIDAARL